ncbi:hypothetical protein BKP64_15265 [Marinobacter salinus]|uniref:Uncharacterized protein n=1 Tax=Marinobacter salinus TaxID=1874317 RepID=A0A1D9GP48_9GAMM|nr:hypothetical protein BKP64_15265 [Marinobacter salinus]
MLFQKPTPKIIQRIADERILQVCKTLSTEDNDVQSGKIGLMPEGFSDLSLYPVSLNSQLQILFGKNQTDPGMTEFIRRCQDQKIPVRNFQLYVIKDFAVISWPQKAVRFRKIQSLHEADNRLRRQTCAAFGTTTGNNLTAVCCGHTGTKTVDALTLQDAWLKRSFHGDDLTIRQLVIQSLAGKRTAKTGAAFYANTGGNSMFIDRGLCRWDGYELFTAE